MAYTLQMAFADGSLPEAVQITHLTNLNTRMIESISVQELPMGNFIKENELVLTTAIGCNMDPDGFKRIVDECIHLKASAVLFCFYDSTFHIPDAVIVSADRAGLPLLQIPWKYRFADIQESILRGIQNEKAGVYTKLQSLLFSLFLSGASLEAVVDQIQDTLHIKIAITDKYQHFIAGERDYTHFLPDCYPIPITVKKLMAGTLYILSDTYYSDKEQMRFFISNIVPPVLLWFHQREIENYEKRQLRNQLVWSLAHNKATNTELYKEQAAELNICLDLDYCCIVSELICQKASVPDDTSYPSMPQINLYIDLEQQIIFLLKQTRLHYMFARKNNFFVIYIETAASIRQIIQTLLSRIKWILSDSFPGYTFCHGIYLYDTTEKANHPQCYKRAKQALSYCKNNPAQCNGIFFYENTAKNILFTALKNDIFVCELCRSVMKGLLKEEDAFNRELLLTLSQYIRCNYNKNETARELNLHRQSLIYRLKKIEELTGLSLNDHDSLYLLESCLRLLRLI